MAGNSTKIDEVVDSVAVDKQLSDAKKATSELKKEFIDTLKAANDLNNAIGKVSGTQQYNKAVNDAAIATERLAQAQIKTQTAQERLTQATIRTQQAQDRQTASVQKTSGAYQVLNAAYQEATALARNAGAQFGETSQQFQNAARSANFLRERLDAIDRPLGNYQRNVGNYRSAFDGLGNSVQQLSRELPAFAVSAQTGILALSNNLPIFFDQIKRTRQEVAALRAEGKETPGVFARIVQSLTSPIGLLTLGVTVLTLFSKEIVEFTKSLFKGTEALNKFTESQKNLGEALKSNDFKKANTDIAELTTNINLAKEGFLSKDAVLKQYNEKLGDTLGKANSLNEAEKILTDKGDAFIKLTLLKAQAQSALSMAVDLANQALAKQTEGLNFGDVIKSQLSSVGSFLQAGLGNINYADAASVGSARLKKEAGDLNKRADLYKSFFEDLQKQAAVFSKDKNLSFFNGNGKGGADLVSQQLKLQQAQLKIIQDSQKFISEDESKSYDERLAALKKWSEVSLQLIDIDGKLKLRAENLSDIERQTIEKETYNNRINSQREYNAAAAKIDKERLDELDKLQKDYNKQLENYQKEVFDNRTSDANMYYAEQILATNRAKQADIDALTDQYKQGIIKKAEYEKIRKDIEDGYAQESVKDQISLAEDLIKIKKESNKDTSKDEIELANLQIRLAELVTGKKLEGIEKEKAKRQELNAAIKNLAEEAGNFIISLVDAGFTNRKNQIEAQKEDLEKQTQQEIDAVDRSLGTEQEKADKIALIKAKQQSQNEAFARQQKKIDVEKAKFDKAVAIARIIENTAIGITSALAQFPPNVPLSILIGALGAVQLGTVLAQPIPQYAKGTKNHKGGLSIIGEEGAEKVDLPNGKSFISANTAQLINLPAGTKVTPHGETMRMIGKPDDLQKYTGGQQVPWDELISELRKNRPQKSKQNINVHVHGSYEAYKAQRLNGRL